MGRTAEIVGGGAPVRDEPLAVELMNTVWADRDGVHDALARAGDASSWLAAVRERLPEVRVRRGGTRTSLTAGDAARLRRLRDAVRAVAAEATSDPRPVATDPPGRTRPMQPDEAVAEVNAAADLVPAAHLRRAGAVVVAERTAESSLDRILGAFAEDAVTLLGGDHDAGRVRACLAPGCVLYFVQGHTAREWCSPSCGNRARVARHYEKSRARRGTSTEH